MSSPNNNNNSESNAGETNISLDDEVSLDEKTKDSIISHEDSISSKISDNPMELHEGVLDFEVDASDIQKTEESNGKPEKTGDDKDDVADPSARDEGKNDEDGELEDGENEDSPKEPEEAPKKSKKRNDSDLEDGEVTDSDEEETVKVTPEEEPSGKSRDEKPPICRFFSRGQCTWGNQCRFVHPGGMGRGPSPFSHQGRTYGGAPTPFPPPGGPYSSLPMAPVENAWERGLRNAKQLLKEANRRREEDPAFEDRRLHQGLQESPPREISLRPSPSPSPPLRSKLYGTFDKNRDGRSASPLNVDRWKEERHAAANRSRQGPGDSWRDPWMRSKSPARRPKRRSRSSSSRSYSSSISSASSYSSSRSSSRSRSRDRRRDRGGPASRGYRGSGRQRYPSERGRLVASPSPTRYRSRAPAAAAAAAAAGVAAPPPPVTMGRPRRRSSSSSSSSRSRSRSPRRRRFSRSRTPEGIPRRPRQPSVGRTVAPPIKMNLLDKSKKLPTKRPFSASPSRSPSESPKKARLSPSPPPARSAAPVDVKKKTEKKSDAAKREELMKQLKAVEDAIAKKKARA